MHTGSASDALASPFREGKMTTEPPEEIPLPTWNYWRELIGSAARSQAWRTVGLWAVDLLQERLGEQWPQRAWEKFGRLPAGIELAPTHPVAFAELAELALRLELCRDCERFPRVRRTLASNANEDEVAHLRMQLEVATLALHASHAVEFEPIVPGGGRRGDLQLNLAGDASALVETRAILMTEQMRRAQRFSDDMFDAIRAIGFRHGVECEGEITRVLDEQQTSVLLGDLARHAGLVARGITLPAFRAHGVSLNVRPGAGIGGGLKGPATGGDAWPRLATRLRQKAEQTRGAEGVWLRLDVRAGLWQFTDWAREDLPAKLVLLHHNVSSVLVEQPHVAGVVMTPGSVLAQGTFTNDDHEGVDGAFALRRLITPLRGRETMGMPLGRDEETLRLAGVWRDLYAGEPRWLDDALDAFGLPRSDEVFAVHDASSG